MANKKKNVKSKTKKTTKVTTKTNTKVKETPVKKTEEKKVLKKSGINEINSNSSKLIVICVMIMAIILILSTFGANIEELFAKYDITYNGDNYTCGREIVYDIKEDNVEYLDSYLKNKYETKEAAIKACETEETNILSKNNGKEEYCGYSKECKVVNETEEAYNLLIKKIVCYSNCKLK